MSLRARITLTSGDDPGVVPPFGRTVEEEGALFELFQLVSVNEFHERELRDAAAAGRYPARNPDQNVADLRAQLAANARGIAEIEHVLCNGTDSIRCALTCVTCRTTLRLA